MTRPTQIGCVQHDILDSLAAGPMTVRQIAEDTGRAPHQIYASTRELGRRGMVSRDGPVLHITQLGESAAAVATSMGRVPGVPTYRVGEPARHQNSRLGHLQRRILAAVADGSRSVADVAIEIGAATTSVRYSAAKLARRDIVAVDCDLVTIRPRGIMILEVKNGRQER